MLSATDYLVAWSLYLLAATVLLLTVWRLTSGFWAWAKDSLRVIAAVLLLTPGVVDAAGDFLAPAIFIVAFELLAAEGGGVGPLLGVRLLLILIIAVLSAWLLRLLWYWLVSSRRSAPAQPARPVAQRIPPRTTSALRVIDIRDRNARRQR